MGSRPQKIGNQVLDHDLAQPEWGTTGLEAAGGICEAWVAFSSSSEQSYPGRPSLAPRALWKLGLHLPKTSESGPQFSPAQSGLQARRVVAPIGLQGWAGSEEFKCGRN